MLQACFRLLPCCVMCAHVVVGRAWGQEEANQSGIGAHFPAGGAPGWLWMAAWKCSEPICSGGFQVDVFLPKPKLTL